MLLTASKTASCTIATYRAWPKGPLGAVVFTAIRFQSRTASAFATAGPNNRVAINMHRPRVHFVVSPDILFIGLPPILAVFDLRDPHSLVWGGVELPEQQYHTVAVMSRNSYEL